MGMNYFWYEKPQCPHCGREFPPIHIGKSSHGWTFGLHVDPYLGINSLEDWKARFAVKGSYIKNEGGEVVTPSWMLQEITQRAFPAAREITPDFLRNNNAVLGPNGLVRHRVDNYHCIGHGKGTWDLMAGEFR